MWTLAHFFSVALRIVSVCLQNSLYRTLANTALHVSHTECFLWTLPLHFVVDEPSKYGSMQVKLLN